MPSADPHPAVLDWTRRDLPALAATGATSSSMTGYTAGTLANPDGAAELLHTAGLSLRAAEELGCPRLNVHGTGLDQSGLPVVGEIQVADHPGRCEPGTGEIAYPVVAAALARLGYDPVLALERFRAASTTGR